MFKLLLVIAVMMITINYSEQAIYRTDVSYTGETCNGTFSARSATATRLNVGTECFTIQCIANRGSSSARFCFDGVPPLFGVVESTYPAGVNCQGDPTSLRAFPTNLCSRISTGVYERRTCNNSVTIYSRYSVSNCNPANLTLMTVKFINTTNLTCDGGVQTTRCGGDLGAAPTNSITTAPGFSSTLVISFYMVFALLVGTALF